MATTFTWKLQSNDIYGQDTEIGETDVLQFAGAGGLNDPIFVGEYNDKTLVRNSGGTDISAGNIPNNNKFVSQDGGTGGDSEVEINGGAAQDLDTVSADEAALLITVEEEVNVTVTNAIFYTYNGSNPATAVAGLDVRAAEIGDANFTQVEGSGNALELTDSDTPALSHTFEVVMSVGLTALGLKSGKMRFEAVIQ